MRTLTFLTGNREGLLSEMTYILGKSRIPIEGLDVDVIGDNAIIDLTVRNSMKAGKILEKNGFKLIQCRLIVKVCGKEERECLEFLKGKLKERGIKLKNAELICKDESRGMFSIDADQPRRAVQVITMINSAGC